MNLNIVQGFTQKTCGNCGIVFFVPEAYEEECLKTGQGWHCPNGHSRAYSESKADKYKRLYEAEQSARKAAEYQKQQALIISNNLRAELEQCEIKKKTKKKVKA